MPAAVDWSSAVILATPSTYSDEAIKTTAQALGPGIEGMGMLLAVHR